MGGGGPGKRWNGVREVRRGLGRRRWGCKVGTEWDRMGVG